MGEGRERLYVPVNPTLLWYHRLPRKLLLKVLTQEGSAGKQTDFLKILWLFH
jgi:hypothetical protein